MAERCPKGKKTLLEKEKLLVTSNFSFSHNVFKRLVLQTCKIQDFFGKSLKEECIQQGLITICVISPLYTVFNIVQDLLRPCFSGVPFYQWSVQYSFQATGCFPTCPLLKLVSCETGMNPVLMTIINRRKNDCQDRIKPATTYF